MMKSFSLPKSWRFGLMPKVAVVCFFLVLIFIGAVPGYWTGNWPWAKPPTVTNLKQIKNLRETGLEIPGWQTLEQQKMRLGGHTWSFQVLKGDNPKPVQLLLLPQNDHKSQPQVEWVDIDGFERWQTDSYTKLQFTVEASPSGQSSTGAKPTPSAANVEARFFRAWNQRQTFAVLQWYAWPDGGHPAINRWFWADQLAQLRRERVPWVAVCVKIPMEPLGDLKNSRTLAESLGKMIQTTLMAGPLARG